MSSQAQDSISAGGGGNKAAAEGLDCLLILLPRCFTWAMSVLLAVRVARMLLAML